VYLDTTLFTCDLGFNLQGTSVRTCGPDGTWDNAQPTCEIAGTDKKKEKMIYFTFRLPFLSVDRDFDICVSKRNCRKYFKTAA